ncbi:EAL domain-containing protein [Diaphorobacter sp. HDW4B]|uniref:bifunctional diguanylate cyclase/phosphodiesterase n=1 Tax=Diaphorobacter sp. HDW4B TaxID=2714925 RepID=UPI00140CCE30|nr:EAL domain-containing protein [Diaphorobacter sp. HDW4B]QIL73026.1 EAL domain-containing protein [Diaphorobacter sp. HDW4B]
MSELPSSRFPLRFWVPGLTVAILGSLGSFALWRHQQNSATDVAQMRFEQEASAYTQTVQRRFQSYMDILSGLQGVLKLNPQLQRRDFEKLASNMELSRRHPGALGVSFTRHVAGADREEFLKRTRGEPSLSGHSTRNFDFKPADFWPEYFVIEYLWPHKGNEGIEGLEMHAQPLNMQAVVRARDTKNIAISAPFSLIQKADTASTGVVMRMPVFAALDALNKDGDFIGTVDVAVSMSDLVDNVKTEGHWEHLALNMNDLGELDADGLLVPLKVPAPIYQSAPAVGADGLRIQKDVHFGGRLWRLSFEHTTPLLSPLERNLPALMAGAGMLLTALLTALVILLSLRRQQALSHADDVNAALLASEERFRTLFGQAAVGIIQVACDTFKIERANQTFANMLGYTVEEIEGKGFQNLTHPDDAEVGGDRLRRMIVGELASVRMEKRYLRKDGKPVWVDVTVTPVSHRKGRPMHNVSVVLDITERKQMEEALRTSEERLRGILDRLPIGIGMVRDGSFDFSNERFSQICGYDTHEICRLDAWWDAMVRDPQERELYQTRWDEACREAREGNGYIRAMECVITHKGGHARSLEMAGVILGGDDEGYLITLVDVSQRKAVEERARYLAYYDPLTQLPNRRLLLDRLQQALAMSARHQSYGAVLMLDLDNFKSLNETQGHDMGDRLLGIVAQRLRSCVHADDTVARHGGDEFVVVLRSLGESEQAAAAGAEEVAQKILNVMREPFELSNEHHHTTLSIGITLFHGQRESADELLKRGDLAMYRAKAEGRNALRFFDPEMQAVVEARVALEADMRTGIAQGQFEFAYQPQMLHGRIVGAEALLRWQHPQKGAISPAQFIPLAEDSGLILRLGEWGLKAACERLARWANDPVLSELTLSVNVSARQFHQAGFVPQVLAALASTGADARHLRLELTESLLLEDIDDTVKKMSHLKSYGVGFSLDDFGTGYSSLSYLKRLPLDELKIDQGFVRDVLTDPNDAAIAKTIVALGTSLGLQVTAEGVETEAQRQFLERNHCYGWQGYLLSPPLPIREYEALVQSLAHAKASSAAV